MALKKEYVRDGKRRILGSITSGFGGTTSIVRDENSAFLGRTNERFRLTRDARGGLVSVNTSDPGLLFPRKA